MKVRSNVYKWISALALAAVFVLAQGRATAQVAYTAIPDADPRSGRMVNLVNGLQSLGEAGTWFGIRLSEDQPNFELGIFDGDTSFGFRTGGLWDWFPSSTPATYTLYHRGTGVIVQRWSSTVMPDNDWFTWSGPLPAGDYVLDVAWSAPVSGDLMNCFKVRSTGGLFLLAESRYGFVGFGSSKPTVYDPVAGGPTTYDGTWSFLFFVPQPATGVRVWDGDFDRADDENSPGDPRDDGLESSALRFPPNIYYTVTDPAGRVWENSNPSGNMEWESFTLTPPVGEEALPVGLYRWDIKGADGRNTLFVKPEFDMFTPALGSLGDRVWYDANGNGLQDAGEPGVAGVTVELYRYVYGAGAQLVATTTTVANGLYGFKDLEPGQYYVKFYPPATYAFTVRDAEGNTLDALDSDADLTGATPLYLVVGGLANTTVDAGLVETPQQLASLGDRVWCDANGNGVQDAGEPGVSGVMVDLLDAAGNVLKSVVTDANGLYLFADLAPGTFQVRFFAPAGYAFTTPLQGGSGDFDSNADPATGLTGAITLSGATDLSWDAGLVVAGNYRTQTQGGWGSKPSGNNPGAFLAANFSRVYPSGVTIGGRYTIKLRSAKAVEDFLPQGGTAAALKKNYVIDPANGLAAPKKTEAGVLAGQVLALQLSVDFSRAGLTRPGLELLKVQRGPLAGVTVAQVLAWGNAALGGDSVPVSISVLNEVLTNCNEAFDDGTTNTGYLK
ncbi:MAG: SdrD B-like domain-containing protein [Armatimonadota bacterium]|nr:SdrD B-like domain-containing protein [Armatimonadota bacterium]